MSSTDPTVTCIGQETHRVRDAAACGLNDDEEGGPRGVPSTTYRGHPFWSRTELGKSIARYREYHNYPQSREWKYIMV